MKKNNYDVFLGGTTNDSTWRDIFILLMKNRNRKIKCFNPVVDNWTTDCIRIENMVKWKAKYHVYVLTPKMSGVYSIAEMIESAHISSKKTIFFIKDEDKNIDEYNDVELIHWDPKMRNSLVAVSNLLKMHGAIQANSLEEIVKIISDDYGPIKNDKVISKAKVSIKSIMSKVSNFIKRK